MGTNAKQQKWMFGSSHQFIIDFLNGENIL